MRIFRWDISRPKAFLIGAAIAVGVIVLIAASVGRSNSVVPPAATSLAVSGNKEIGTWIWDPVDEMSTSTMVQLIASASENHFNTIYLSIDAYLDIEAMPVGAAQTRAEQNFSSAAYNFISLAHEKNIVVDAEAGETDWGEPQNYQSAYDILNFVQSFNAAHDDKFRGVQFDIESYSLPQYSSDPTTVLTQYVQLVENLVNQDETAASAPLPLTMIVPYFYTASSDGETAPPQIMIDGITDYPYNQIVRLLNQLPQGDGRVIVLAYRNSASGQDGSIALGEPEISAADSSNVHVIVAQETGNVEPSTITFYGMPQSDLIGAVQEINTAFSSDPAYAGVAVDYLQSFLALPS